jgi:SAM-dependent methyltransferase
MTNPMVEPIYLATSPSTDKIPLTGRVLIFGAGKMIHERNCFSFDKCSEVVLYDPYNKDWEDLEFIPDGVRLTKLDRARSFTEILTENPFDCILALFSLHYESQWLFALEHIFNLLKKDGFIYFAEDYGFRAILDGNFKFINNISEILPDFSLEKAEKVKKQAQKVFRDRNTDDLSIPWYPDISASNYSLVFKILSFMGEMGEKRVFDFSQKINLKNDLDKFLPWKQDFCNPVLTKEFAEITHTTLAKENEDITVTEKIHIHQLKKNRDFPDIKNERCLNSKSIWDIVAYHACNNIAKVVIPLDSNVKALVC